MVLLENHWLFSRIQVYFITLCLTKISVSGTSKWGKGSDKTPQYLKHSLVGYPFRLLTI